MIDRSTRITIQNATLFLGGMVVSTYSIAALTLTGIRTPVFDSLLREIPWSGYCHIIPGSLALILGAVLLSRRVRRKQIWLHKSFGYAYVACVLISTIGAHVGNFASPSPMSAKLAFFLLGILWPIVTLMGTPMDDMFDRQAHGSLMKVSYALTFAAVTLRIYLATFLALGFAFERAFTIAAWASWVGNLIFLFTHFRTQAWLRQRSLNKLIAKQ